MTIATQRITLCDHCERLSDYGVMLFNSNKPIWQTYPSNAGIQIGAAGLTLVAMVCDMVASSVFLIMSLFWTEKQGELAHRGWVSLQMGSYGGYLVMLLALRRLLCPCAGEAVTP